MLAYDPDLCPSSAFKLRFTPAEWRWVLHDESFLKDPGNSISPRRLMGVPVEIVPDHRWRGQAAGACGAVVGGL